MTRGIFKRRLIFVTGKGGVGKSSASASLAKRLGESGRRAALAELTPEHILCRHFLIPPSGQFMREISPKITLYHLQTDNILAEFVDEKFHFKGVYKTFLDNRFVKYFLDATPGFNEFLIMGKLFKLVKHENPPFDTVIVDAPSTGHAIAMLEVPRIVAKAVHRGPLKELAVKSLNLITDKTKCGVIIVSMAEEMPATEAVFLKDAVRKLGLATIGLVINKVEQEIKANIGRGAIPARHRKIIDGLAHLNSAIRKNQKVHIDNLKLSFGGDTVKIPTLMGRDEAGISEEISRYFINE